MSWDFVEVNAIGEQTGGFAESLRWTIEALEGTAAELLSARAGCASPGLLPTGMVVLETLGAKSGVRRRARAAPWLPGEFQCRRSGTGGTADAVSPGVAWS